VRAAAAVHQYHGWSDENDILCVSQERPPRPSSGKDMMDSRRKPAPTATDRSVHVSVADAEDPPGHGVATAATALTRSRPAGQPPHYSAPRNPAARLGLLFASTSLRFFFPMHCQGWAHRSGLAVAERDRELNALLTTDSSRYLSI